MRLIGSIVVLIVLAASQPHRKEAHEIDAAPDSLVIQAILSGPITERIWQWEGRNPAESRKGITLSSETLILCRPGNSRCVGPDAVQIARHAAASGRWPVGLTAQFERNFVPTLLAAVSFPNLSMAPRLSDLAGDGPYPMAVTAPVYVRDKSLVYVHFGHGYNNCSFLVLVGNSAEKPWAVEAELLVSIGDLLQ